MFWIWSCAFYLAFQGSLVARLTWWEFSWDIMEPITYLISFTTTTLALFYFAVTRSDYTFESLYDKLKNRKQRSLFKVNSFDDPKYHALKAQVAEQELELKSYGAFPLPEEIPTPTPTAPASPASPAAASLAK